MKYSINGTGTIGYPNGKQNKIKQLLHISAHIYTQKNETPIKGLIVIIKMLNMRTVMRTFYDLMEGGEAVRIS